MEGQNLLECPYDKHHRILEHRMQVHLIKCRRNHPNEPKATCPFNVTHVVNKAELVMHVQDCPDRKVFEALRHTDTPVATPTVPPPMPKVQCEESWDNEDAPTYNPMSYVAQAPVIRNLQGAQPAERKRFREEERRRYLKKINDN